MRCAWEALLGILPPQLRKNVDVQGREEAQELRLRLGQAPELVMDGKSLLLPGSTSREELDYIVNAASRYSPWAAATAAQGYLTAPGGHRIGLCGQVVYREPRWCHADEETQNALLGTIHIFDAGVGFIRQRAAAVRVQAD